MERNALALALVFAPVAESGPLRNFLNRRHVPRGGCSASVQSVAGGACAGGVCNIR